MNKLSRHIVLFAFALALTTHSADAARKPNFIVIFCDNLGNGDIEPFGSKIHRTPNLSRMAREGRKFTHFCVTAGVCTPSRSSIMTGCYPQRVQMHHNPRDGHVLRPVSPYGLHPDEVTIAEVLKKQGYATACVGKWHLGDQTPFLPTRQGFDEYYGVPYSDDMTEAVGIRISKRKGYDKLQGKLWPPLPLMDGEKVVEAPADRDLLTKKLNDRCLQFIEKNKDRPFFLYFPEAMPGSTSAPFASPAFKGKSKNGPWGDSIEELDWSAGRILDKLVELGIEKDTLVIWTSDNGAPLARDMTSPTRGSNLPYHGRGYTTSEGAYRMPTIMWWPGRIKAGTTCTELATTMDLLPTFAGLAGGSAPKDRIIDGHDIAPLILNQPNARTPYNAFYYYYQDQLQAVRSGPWKLFVPLKTYNRHPHFKKGQGDKPLLFHLYRDISCKENVAEKNPDVVKRLKVLASLAREDIGDKGAPGPGLRKIGRVSNPVAQVLK
ncbi:MAG: arylsulfatase [Verrucomicrobiales bacterium]|nr:arylsulfatase [Verrucomicrobiales bacterium]|tara:strand:- start:1310 stop:2782 length:1473 start_codon:yes stop_codon:yes gene_type:complete